MSETPEFDKMIAVRKDSQIIGEFLEWAGHNGYTFNKVFMVEVQDFWGNIAEEPSEVPVRIEDALAHYFEIDLDRVRAEKDALYARLREASACQRGAEKDNTG